MFTKLSRQNHQQIFYLNVLESKVYHRPKQPPLQSGIPISHLFSSGKSKKGEKKRQFQLQKQMVIFSSKNGMLSPLQMHSFPCLVNSTNFTQGQPFCCTNYCLYMLLSCGDIQSIQKLIKVTQFKITKLYGRPTHSKQ